MPFRSPFQRAAKPQTAPESPTIQQLREAYLAEERIFNEVSDPRLQDAAWHRMQALKYQMAVTLEFATRRSASATGSPAGLQRFGSA